ncbi:hypothetical protein C2G38_2047883 [Gigaspora rosea]|uniref:Uncharacterized protein n=1 Tax=Gigaspora rosea TaxID=44941 RepID=A0A397UCL4_9GLOM|nr:hypothetical protein C2G38_2047883 [Gigaspora rosea]
MELIVVCILFSPEDTIGASNFWSLNILCTVCKCEAILVTEVVGICKKRDIVDSSDEVSYCSGIILLSDSFELESSLSVTPSYDKKLTIEQKSFSIFNSCLVCQECDEYYLGLYKKSVENTKQNFQLYYMIIGNLLCILNAGGCSPHVNLGHTQRTPDGC